MSGARSAICGLASLENANHNNTAHRYRLASLVNVRVNVASGCHHHIKCTVLALLGEFIKISLGFLKI